MIIERHKKINDISECHNSLDALALIYQLNSVGLTANKELFEMVEHDLRAILVLGGKL